MIKKLLFAVFIALAAGAAYLYWNGLPLSPLDPAINSKIDQALERAVVDVSEFGGGSVSLVNGEATFGAVEEIGGGRGSVSLGKPRAIVVKGEDADALALLNINGGGTGTFQYLVHFEYIGAEDQVHEIEKILLGDRIIVDNIIAEITAPTSYEVLVSLKDRNPGEGMAAEPTEPRVLTFSRGSEGLKLKAIVFGTIEKHDVVLVSPLPGDDVAQSFLVQGAARGPWYFEASFPIELQTMNGEVLATIIAQAQGEWMTTELVPFSTYMVAPSTAHGLHVLVLKKDNPSGLPEHDASITIPVVIK